MVYTKIPLNPPLRKGETVPPFSKGGKGGFEIQITQISEPQLFSEVSIASRNGDDYEIFIE